MTKPEPMIAVDAFERLVNESVPYVGILGCRVRAIDHGSITVRLPYHQRLLRPGGTICGPAMMAVSDVAMYGAVLSSIGQVELAVTTDLNMHFLRKPEPGDLLAEARVLKIGRTLCVAEAFLHIAESNDLVAHATATYALPPAAQQIR